MEAGGAEIGWREIEVRRWWQGRGAGVATTTGEGADGEDVRKREEPEVGWRETEVRRWQWGRGGGGQDAVVATVMVMVAECARRRRGLTGGWRGSRW